MMKLFSEEQRRGAVVLLPLLVIVVLLAALGERRNPEKRVDNRPNAESEEFVELQLFNPNEFEYEELRAAGLPTKVAAGIVRWRRYGKVYRIKEDVALVSGVTDSMYAALKPYIVIADSLAPKVKYADKVEQEWGGKVKRDIPIKPAQSAGPSVELVQFRIDTASVAYLASIGFSVKQAEAVVKYRDAIGGITSEQELRACYVVSEEMADRLMPYVIFSEQKIESKTDAKESEKKADVTALVEINIADMVALVSVDGIGEKSAAEIIKYRELLGGYHSVEQLAELNCVTEENFAKFLSQICCDSCKIKKIDINFAGPKELERHPYVSARTLRRIIKQRQLKGGWSRIEEMTEQNILSEDEAKRLAPYLRFGLEATE
ncbi:MAG: helix-hairpin-helix domain-containing protein [Alistipes sp.]|nr:helix-hairpin-helix domain-containing protein [Alistipes sp.]